MADMMQVDLQTCTVRDFRPYGLPFVAETGEA